jgi:hypothetical protein
MCWPGTAPVIHGCSDRSPQVPLAQTVTSTSFWTSPKQVRAADFRGCPASSSKLEELLQVSVDVAYDGLLKRGVSESAGGQVIAL